MKKNLSVKLFSPLSDLILYSLLLIATPFVMLQNYLQASVGWLSKVSFHIWKFDMPYILIIVIIFIFTLIVILRHKLTGFRIFSWLFVVSLIILGYNSTDFYLNLKFYDLQQNWHYIAYAIFSFMMYRFLKTRKLLSSQIISYIFSTAFFLSAFDEVFQLFISDRIFDISDIAKDLWGTVIGIIIIYFVIENGKITGNEWNIRQNKIINYIKQPFSLIFLIWIFAFIFIFFTSILSDIKYLCFAVLIPVLIFLIFFFILHLSQFRIYRIIISSVIIIFILIQGFFFIKYHKNDIIYNSYGLTVYKGIVIPFFDIMIFPDGNFKIVDKKRSFKENDILTVFDYEPDILLIGRGTTGKGGEGFPEPTEVQFLFNCKTKKGVQVVILMTPEACKEFNKFKKDGENVLFIIHNTG